MVLVQRPFDPGKAAPSINAKAYVETATAEDQRCEPTCGTRVSGGRLRRPQTPFCKHAKVVLQACKLLQSGEDEGQLLRARND